MEGVRFFQYNARFVREKQIAKELAGQQVIVSATESYFIARYQGNNPAVITVEAIPAPDTEKINYICMYQQKAQNVLKGFGRLEKNTCLYITGKGKGYQKLKAMVSELHLEGRVILTGWLEKPFAFMNLCDYFICGRGRRKPGYPCCKNHEYEAAGRRLHNRDALQLSGQVLESGTE